MATVRQRKDQLEARAAAIARISRLEGQARGLRRMMEQGRPCQEVLAQAAALCGAAKGLWRCVMASHLRQCFDRRQPGKRDRQTIEAFLEALEQF